MQTVLLTGAAGFIGAEVATQLLEKGFKVVAVDNICDYYDVRLKHFRLNKLREHPQFEFFELDIEDRPRLTDVFKTYNFDAVLNIAARAGVRASLENPYVYMSTNATATLNILEFMRAHGVKKLVLASTSSLYAGQNMPFTEKLAVNTPISPYAASKKAAEVMAYTYHNLYNIDVSVIRYFTVFGPGGRPDMMPFRFINWIINEKEIQLFGDGSASRDFTYVSDIARGTIAAMKPLGYEIINIGGGNKPVSLAEAVGMIETLTGKSARIKYLPTQPADMKSTWADISKAKQLLSWEPKTDFKTGLRQTVEWHILNNAFARTLEI